MILSGATIVETKVLEFSRPKTRKPRQCVICSGSEGLQSFKSQPICLECLTSIRYLYYEGYFDKK